MNRISDDERDARNDSWQDYCQDEQERQLEEEERWENEGGQCR